MESSQKSKDIFKSISEMIVKPEFMDDQRDFYDKYHT